ncbi:MAG: type II toxin-antitoxin system MqsR family toxin [Sphingomonas bacterium]|nr:type II toxin-antitoxin system MqsR family toxin [Sphingomonas bacterium]
MTVKRKAHHDLAAVQAKFASVENLEMKTGAFRAAQALGFGREEVVMVVQALTRSDFVKSETAHNPPNHRCWHDTYKSRQGEYYLYLKFAGETLVDVVLVSFKEVDNG